MIIVDNRTRQIFTWIIITVMSFLLLSVVAYINVIYRLEEVYIANTFIAEGTKIDKSNFSKYISIIKVPHDMYIKMNLLKSSQENQQLIMNNYIKYNRAEGDFITSNIIQVGIKDPMKYLISEISFKAADSKFLIPVAIEIPQNDRIFTKGVQVKDRVQIWFLKNETVNNKKVTKLVVRYKDVPIISLNRQGDYLSSIIIALPSDLAKRYEIEKRQSQEVKIIFNPLNYSHMSENELDVISSEQIENEYHQGKIYDLKDEIKIENITKES